MSIYSMPGTLLRTVHKSGGWGEKCDQTAIGFLLLFSRSVVSDSLRPPWTVVLPVRLDSRPLSQ